MQPCRCPTCNKDLFITCPNGCEDAADGATGYIDPIAMLKRPAGRSGPSEGIAGSKQGARGTGTAGQIVKLLTAASEPMSPSAIAAAIQAPPTRVSVMLVYLMRRGAIVRPEYGRYAAA